MVEVRPLRTTSKAVAEKRARRILDKNPRARKAFVGRIVCLDRSGAEIFKDQFLLKKRKA